MYAQAYLKPVKLKQLGDLFPGTPKTARGKLLAGENHGQTGNGALAHSPTHSLTHHTQQPIAPNGF